MRGKVIVTNILYTALVGVVFVFTLPVMARANYDPSDADSYTTLVVDEDSRNLCNDDSCTPLILIHGIDDNAIGEIDDINNLNKNNFRNLLLSNS